MGIYIALDKVRAPKGLRLVAAGYADGLVLLVRLDDGAEILARKPAAAPITALAWNGSGSALAFGAEDGEAGVVDLG